MEPIGHIREIWRYPVKGMGGERLAQAELGTRGLHGDRIWALRDSTRAEVQSCKTRPDLLRCTARCREPSGDQVDVVFPDGTTRGSDSADIHQRLSTLVGHASTLEPLRPPSDIDFYRRHHGDGERWRQELEATFAREADEPLPDFLRDVPPEVAEFVAAPGSFFLVTPLHLVTTSTLRHLQALNPRSDWDARRFRPNFVVETLPTASGLAERAWLGRRLVIGAAHLDCVSTTPRCGAVTRAQAGLVADSTLLRTIVREADQNVGVYATTHAPGVVHQGDVIYAM